MDEHNTAVPINNNAIGIKKIILGSSTIYQGADRIPHNFNNINNN